MKYIGDHIQGSHGQLINYNNYSLFTSSFCFFSFYVYVFIDFIDLFVCSNFVIFSVTFSIKSKIFKITSFFSNCNVFKFFIKVNLWCYQRECLEKSKRLNIEIFTFSQFLLNPLNSVCWKRFEKSERLFEPWYFKVF